MGMAFSASAVAEASQTAAQCIDVSVLDRYLEAA